MAHLLALHPQMREAAAVLHWAEQQVSLEKALRWPMLGVEVGGTGWSPTAPDRDGHVALVFEIPLFNLRQPLIARARAQQIRVERDNARVAVQLRAGATMAEHTLAAAAVRAHAQVTSILPAARQAADLALEGYRDGAFDINSVLLAEQSLADARIEAYRAVADYGRAWAAHQHALGVMP